MQIQTDNSAVIANMQKELNESEVEIDNLTFDIEGYINTNKEMLVIIEMHQRDIALLQRLF